MKKRHMFLLLASLLLAGCTQSGNSEVVDPSEENPSESEYSEPNTSESEPNIPDVPTMPINEYQTYNGSFTYLDNDITSNENNSICLVPNKTLETGTLSVNVSNFGSYDSGLIFLVNRGNKTKFFEGEDISYYFFFISNAGTLYLGKSFDGGWTNLMEKPISGFSKTKAYDIKVSFEKCDTYVQFHCYLNETYYYSARDFETNVGSEYGLRAGGKDTVFKYIKAFNDVTNPSRQQISSYFVGSGSFHEDGNSLISTSANSIGYIEGGFQLGTISINMTQNGVASDNGLIFGLERNGNVNFWESNVSYYFFFINIDGYPYLGKVNNGSWTTLFFGSAPIDGFKFDAGHTNNLKVERTSTIIKCFVDDVEVCEYIDNSPLFGKDYGVRVGVSVGVSFANLNINKAGDFELMAPTEYDVLSGSFITTNNVNIMTSTPNSLALHKNYELSEGTLSLNLTQGSSNETGVVFRGASDASSFYLFSVHNARTHLYKIDNGNISELTPDEYLSAGYNANSTYETKITIKDNTIYCYFSGILYATYTDNNMLTGTKVGLYSKAPYASFKDVNLSTTPDIKTAETLIIGHSYMELWSNYKNDLSDFNDVYNIGIGGSVSFDWNDMEANIIPYAPKTLIFMIGINDFPRGLSASEVADNVKTLLVNLKAKVPTLTEVALVSVNRCVTHEAFKTQIADTNALYKSICNELSYVHYADVDNAFLTGGNPDGSYFTDGLHPTASSYLIIADAIRTALGR